MSMAVSLLAGGGPTGVSGLLSKGTNILAQTNIDKGSYTSILKEDGKGQACDPGVWYYHRDWLGVHAWAVNVPMNWHHGKKEFLTFVKKDVSLVTPIFGHPAVVAEDKFECKNGNIVRASTTQNCHLGLKSCSWSDYNWQLVHNTYPEGWNEVEKWTAHWDTMTESLDLHAKVVETLQEVKSQTMTPLMGFEPVESTEFDEHCQQGKKWKPKNEITASELQEMTKLSESLKALLQMKELQEQVSVDVSSLVNSWCDPKEDAYVVAPNDLADLEADLRSHLYLHQSLTDSLLHMEKLGKIRIGGEPAIEGYELKKKVTLEEMKTLDQNLRKHEEVVSMLLRLKGLGQPISLGVGALETDDEALSKGDTTRSNEGSTGEGSNSHKEKLAYKSTGYHESNLIRRSVRADHSVVTFEQLSHEMEEQRKQLLENRIENAYICNVLTRLKELDSGRHTLQKANIYPLDTERCGQSDVKNGVVKLKLDLVAASEVPSGVSLEARAETRLATLKKLLVTQQKGAQSGSGGTAEVFPLKDCYVFSGRNSPCALKIAEARSDAEKRVGKAEMVANKALQWVTHKNLPQIYDVFQEGTTRYYVTELLDKDVFDLVYNFKGDRIKAAKNLARQVLLGLNHLHKLNIVHSDIKLENVMAVEKGCAMEDCDFKIIDFGFANVATRKPSDYHSWYTPGYQAPEFALGKKYDNKVDIWAVGVVVFIVLCDAPPFDSIYRRREEGRLRKEDLKQQIQDYDGNLGGRIQEAKCESLSNESLPNGSAAREFLEHAMARKPEERWSAEKLLNHRWLNH